MIPGGTSNWHCDLICFLSYFHERFLVNIIQFCKYDLFIVGIKNACMTCGGKVRPEQIGRLLFCVLWIWLRFCNIITVCIINELLSINGAAWAISPGTPATGCFHTGNNGSNGIRRLNTDSHEVLKLRDIVLELSGRSVIAVKTPFKFQHDTIMQTPSHGFETLRDLTLRCPTV